MTSLKSKEEIKIMREGGKILAKIVKELEKKVKPGVTTEELNRVSEALILNSGGQCSFKGYDGYPACLCTSINNEIVHVAPSVRKLKDGDILSLDLGILYEGYHADMAVTVPVGNVSSEAQRLIRVTKKAFKRGIKKMKPGNTLGDVGNTIQRYVEGQDFGVVRDLCGHGIGKELHEDPRIMNYGKRHSGEEIKEGMVLCLEPMVTVGDWKIQKSEDGYGFETKDGSLSAHFEHMVAVTKNGAKVLTVI